MVLVVWFARRPAKTSVPATAPSQPVETVTATPAPPATNMPDSITGHVTVPTPSNAVSAPRKSKEQETLEILSTKNDIPIVFYGRLEDQFGNPVVGAEITGSTIIYNGVHMGGQKVVVTSDANGFFQLNAGKGESLGIMPKKAGYALATTGTEFRYTRLDEHPYVPDAGNPTVIKMWKLQGAEPLVGIEQRYKLYYTDAPINFDLLIGQIVPTGGDIKLTVNRSPGVLSGRHQQDWSLKVEAVDGGLIETSMGEARVIYVAPDGGYQSDYTFVMSTNNTWFEAVHQMFFVESRGGQVFGKVNLSFRINENPDDFISVTFSGVASTNGSRNWEGDPNTMKGASN